MKMWRAASLVEHPGHPDQKVHAGRRRVTGVTSAFGQKGGAIFTRQNTSGHPFQKQYKLTAGKAQRLHSRLQAIAAKNPKAFSISLHKSKSGVRSVMLQRKG